MAESAERIHLIGIGGIGVSGIARLLHLGGHRVSGSDVKESSITRALRAEGITVHIGHDPAHLREVDRVVYSTAIPTDNPERLAAQDFGIPLVHRAAVLEELLRDRESVGVIGTHGKGTVAALLTCILDEAGRAPGFYVGGLLLDYGTNARLGGGRLLVAEVDESDGSHLLVQPDHVVVNNLELDHLNYYGGLDDIVGTAARFVDGNPRLRELVLNVGCPGVADLATRLGHGYVGCGVGLSAAFQAHDLVADARTVSFSLGRRGEDLGRFTLALPGEYNVENALAAATMALQLGVDVDALRRGLARCRGLENRFTVVPCRGATLVKDYLSHPNGMRKVLKAARRLGPGRLFVVYKPYRYTLLKYLGDEYAQAFAAADRVILTNLYTAGEDPIPGIDDGYLVDRCRALGQHVTHVATTEEIPAVLREQVQPGDVVALFGGDDFFRMADRFAAEEVAP
ncbi:MAG: UDP-N-acetylmuramate--L-alanine ligase [Myxococcota bacterium]|nr:UDP-N-acetylmuramate--L-alanine ligase [Myxococcota bacterium]